MLVRLAPAAAMLGSLLALIILALRHELVALRAAGRGIMTVAAPLAAASLASAALAFLLQEMAMPAGLRAAASIKREIKGDSGATGRENFWYRDGQDHWHVDRWFSVERQAEGLTRIALDDDFRVVRWEQIAKARPGDRAWHLTGIEGWAREGEGFKRMAAADEERPFVRDTAALEDAEYKPDALARHEIRLLSADLERRGFPTSTYKGDLASKNALVMLIPLMALFALPFGVLAPRAANITAAAALCASTTFGLWGLSQFLARLGEEGRWPPVLAAYAGVILMAVLFPIVGTVRLRRMGYL
jgi:LPS export ABC transporter permease LptG